MAVKGPGRGSGIPGVPSTPTAAPGTTPEPVAPKPEVAFERVRGDGHKDHQSSDNAIDERRLGDPTVTARELLDLPSLLRARHLMILLARGRGETREAVLASVGDVLIALDHPETVRSVLYDLTDAGRIVDIYPLEVMRYVIDRRPELVPGVTFGALILNKPDLARAHTVEETIVLKVPLALKMRAFALEGGGSPGYLFCPGPPGEYHFEVGEGGVFSVLVRGDVRKQTFLDFVTISVSPTE